MAKRLGNQDRMTFNYGHDTAKTRLSGKLSGNGFNIYEIRKAILNHPEIVSLLDKGAIKIGKICGQNFVIGAKSELLSVYRPVKGINATVTVIQQVNNIVTAILKGFGFNNYGKTQFWKCLDESKYTYCKRITIGADILSLEWIEKTYSSDRFTCKLSDRQKIDKYQRGN